MPPCYFCYVTREITVLPCKQSLTINLVQQSLKSGVGFCSFYLKKKYLHSETIHKTQLLRYTACRLAKNVVLTFLYGQLHTNLLMITNLQESKQEHRIE